MNRFPRPTQRGPRPVTIPLVLAIAIINIAVVLWLLFDATGYSIIPAEWSPAAFVEQETWA